MRVPMGSVRHIGLFYEHTLNLIPAWKSNYIHHKVWDEIIYPFSNFRSCTVEVWEWILLLHPTPDWACDYVSMLGLTLNHICMVFLCFVMLSFMMGSHGLFTQMLQGCFIGTGVNPKITPAPLWYWRALVNLIRTKPQQNTAKRELWAYFSWGPFY